MCDWYLKKDQFRFPLPFIKRCLGVQISLQGWLDTAHLSVRGVTNKSKRTLQQGAGTDVYPSVSPLNLPSCAELSRTGANGNWCPREDLGGWQSVCISVVQNWYHLLLTFLMRFGHEGDICTLFHPNLFIVPLPKPSKTHSPKHNHAKKECQVYGCTPEILDFGGRGRRVLSLRLTWAMEQDHD